MISLLELLSASIDLCRIAAVRIREILKSGELEIHQKGVNDPVTLADFEAQIIIESGLRKVWPNLKVIGEEDVNGRARCDIHPSTTLLADRVLKQESFLLEDLIVYVDPIDATREFTLGNREAPMTLIGVVLKSTPIAGVIFQPLLENNNLFWGIVGYGVEGLPTRKQEEEKGLTLTITKSKSPQLHDFVQKMQPLAVMRLGGCGYKALQVLLGNADLFVTTGTKRWDSCAPEALLRALGGCVTDLKGQPIDYSPSQGVDNHGAVFTRKGVNHHKILSYLN
eukprot:TRINITY_DN2879_c0_g1_i10.p1 TRINITY_DN2879_c0_g1~~TRINITY_DN2879_c0_g1_i10.p1  ORF type:complete len:281 (+),score=60.59 TRINITY_DN2879_c0_g1_i10:90-932(+)